MPSNKILRLPLGLARQGSCLRPFHAASRGAYPYPYLQACRRPQPSTLPRLTTSARRWKSDSLSVLEQQRLRRPVSPHLTIYRWRYQSLTSILQRFSGIALSGAVYVFAVGYLLAPALPTALQLFDVESTVAAVGTLPVWAKLSAKFALVLPFTFHAFNGIKQLVFDGGRGLTSKLGIARSSWIVAGCSLVSALYLAY